MAPAVVLNGGSSSGKTSIARGLQRLLGPTWMTLGCGLDKHMAIVGYLKSEHGMGHGHASALVGWTLAGNVARP